MSSELNNLFANLLESQPGNNVKHCQIFDNFTKRECVYTDKSLEEIAESYNWDLVSDDIHEDYYGSLNEEKKYDEYYAEETTYYGKYVEKITTDVTDIITNVHEREYIYQLITDIGSNLSGKELIDTLKNYLDRDQFKMIHDFLPEEPKSEPETKKLSVVEEDDEEEDDDDDDDDDDDN
jgi:hypothetical protein